MVSTAQPPGPFGGHSATTASPLACQSPGERRRTVAADQDRLPESGSLVYVEGLPPFRRPLSQDRFPALDFTRWHRDRNSRRVPYSLLGSSMVAHGSFRDVDQNERSANS